MSTAFACSGNVTRAGWCLSLCTHAGAEPQDGTGLVPTACLADPLLFCPSSVASVSCVRSWYIRDFSTLGLTAAIAKLGDHFMAQ